MTKFRFGLAAAVAVGVCAGATLALAEDAPQADIDAMRKALAKYEDPYVAVRDLYLSTVGCVHYDGSTMEGHLNYPKGAMGIHFVNLTIQGPLDPAKPNVLIYEPLGKGKLKLVAAEWLVPLAVAKERPVLLGQPFQGPDGRPRAAHPARASTTMTCTPGCSRTTRMACSAPPIPM